MLILIKITNLCMNRVIITVVIGITLSLTGNYFEHCYKHNKKFEHNRPGLIYDCVTVMWEIVMANLIFIIANTLSPVQLGESNTSTMQR